MVNTRFAPGPCRPQAKVSPLDQRCPKSAQPGGPKTCMALAEDTPIPTLKGWVLLQDIEPGQMVFDERGEPCSVIAVCRRGPEPVSRVEFDDKAVLIAGEHHHWVSILHQQRHRVRSGRNSVAGWATDLMPATTADIRRSLVIRESTADRAMHSIPLARPLRCPEAELAIDPYLLGLWLGDGSCGAASITSHRDDEPHYRRRAEAAGENWRIRASKGDTLDCTLTCGPHPLFRSRLREMEVLRDKHIPTPYLRAGNDQRL